MNLRGYGGYWSRRDFLETAALAGAGVLLGFPSESTAAERPPETTRIRLAYHSRSLCHAPLYLAEDSLRAEGFTEIQYVKTSAVENSLAGGEVDVVTHFCGPLAAQVDNGDPIVILSGLHPGCVELVCAERVRSLRDLKGKTIAVTDLGGGRHVLLAVMVAHIGLGPAQGYQHRRTSRGRRRCGFLRRKRSMHSSRLRLTRSSHRRKKSATY